MALPVHPVPPCLEGGEELGWPGWAQWGAMQGLSREQERWARLATRKPVPGPRGPPAKGQTHGTALGVLRLQPTLSQGVASFLRLCPAPAQHGLSFLSFSAHTLPRKITFFLLSLLAPLLPGREVLSEV